MTIAIITTILLLTAHRNVPQLQKWSISKEDSDLPMKEWLQRLEPVEQVEFTASNLYGGRARVDVDVKEGDYKLPTRESLQQMVGDNPKYLTKDSWASFGYNNIRYMLETTLLFAQIGGRIPVLQDTVWARACAVEE